MKIRIAAVSFVNAVPLIEGLTEEKEHEVEVVTALPSRLVELLHSEQADAALLPVVEYFRWPAGGLVPGVGIVAPSAVSSVKLFARVAPSAIARVAVDRGSRTSVALLRILLAERYGVRPDFLTVEPRPETLLDDAEAALVIGDRCLEVERHFAAKPQAQVRSHDLGKLWHDLTGLPFVFAVWVLSARFNTPEASTSKSVLIHLLTRARDRGLANLDDIAEREAALGRPGYAGETTPEALRRYLGKSLGYVIGEREEAGLRRFHEYCVKHAIVPAGRPAQLAAAGEGKA